MFMVVADVFIHQPSQMLLIHYDHVVKQFPSAATNPSLSDAILPRTSETGPIASASATSATSPVPIVLPCSHWLAFTWLVRLSPLRLPQIPAIYMALPALRSQHAHRSQPFLATTGLPMQTVRFFLIPLPISHSRTCSATSSHTCVLTKKVPTYSLFLYAGRTRLFSFLHYSSRTYPSSRHQFHARLCLQRCSSSTHTP